MRECLHVCIYVHHLCVWCPQKPLEGIRYLEMLGARPFLKTKLGPLPEQQVFSTTQTSLPFLEGLVYCLVCQGFPRFVNQYKISEHFQYFQRKDRQFRVFTVGITVDYYCRLVRIMEVWPQVHHLSKRLHRDSLLHTLCIYCFDTQIFKVFAYEVKSRF